MSVKYDSDRYGSDGCDSEGSDFNGSGIKLGVDELDLDIDVEGWAEAEYSEIPCRILEEIFVAADANSVLDTHEWRGETFGAH